MGVLVTETKLVNAGGNHPGDFHLREVRSDDGDTFPSIELSVINGMGETEPVAMTISEAEGLIQAMEGLIASMKTRYPQRLYGGSNKADETQSKGLSSSLIGNV